MTSLFSSPFMDFVHDWYDDRYWSKILRQYYPIPHLDLSQCHGQNFHVKVLHLSFRTSLFPNAFMISVHIGMVIVIVQ